MFFLQLVKSSLHILEVSRLGSKLLPHRLFQLVERHFKVLDVKLTILDSSLLFREVAAQCSIDRCLSV